MNSIPADLTGFDFAWSSCALEHLGTLAAGMDFVVAQMACLQPGGVAVHTTEYLVSSNDTTVEAGGTVFYRRRDIESLVQRLQRAGHDVDMDYSLGSTPDDVHVDVPPYTDVHLRTELAGHVTTSLALIVTKGADARAARARAAGCCDASADEAATVQPLVDGLRLLVEVDELLEQRRVRLARRPGRAR